jgi:hypothetical protein
MLLPDWTEVVGLWSKFNVPGFGLFAIFCMASHDDSGNVKRQGHSRVDCDAAKYLMYLLSMRLTTSLTVSIESQHIVCQLLLFGIV